MKLTAPTNPLAIFCVQGECALSGKSTRLRAERNLQYSPSMDSPGYGLREVMGFERSFGYKFQFGSGPNYGGLWLTGGMDYESFRAPPFPWVIVALYISTCPDQSDRCWHPVD